MVGADVLLAGAVMLQIAFVLLVDDRQRHILQSTAPVTTLLIVVYSAASAAVAGGVVRVSDLELPKQNDNLVAEPWRLITCMLVYSRIAALAAHLWLLFRCGPTLEARVGSRAFAFLLISCGAVAMVLRTLLLAYDHRPALLTAAPLFAVLLIWARLIGHTGHTISKYLPWLLLVSLGCLEGPEAALPGLLGCGAGTIFEAVLGLPPAKPAEEVAATSTVAQQVSASGGDSVGAESAASQAGGNETVEGEAVPADSPKQGSTLVRNLQFVAVAYLIASALNVDSNTEDEAARLQCIRFADALDISSPLTAQLLSNFTSERLDLAPDAETPLRAFEWLLLRWASPDDEARKKIAAEAEAAGPSATAAARHDLYKSQLRREVKQLVDEYLPTLEVNSAQSDQEVLDILLKQLGYPPAHGDDVVEAWIEGIKRWRDKKALDESHLAALRLFLETGSMDNVRAELSEELHDSNALINATLSQFEVPADMPPGTVRKELLQEMDMDMEDVAERAISSLDEGINLHIAHRAKSSQERLHETLSELLATITTTTPHAVHNGDVIGLSRHKRVSAERLVARALTQLPGKLGSNEDAFQALVAALNLTSSPEDSSSSSRSDIERNERVLAPSLLAMLRVAAFAHCDGLRRQAKREQAIAELRKLLVPDSDTDDPVPPILGDEAGAADEEGPDTAQKVAHRTWQEDGGVLVGMVYGGYEEQAREMNTVELILDLLRMAQLHEDEIRKAERIHLETAVKQFVESLKDMANKEVVDETPSHLGPHHAIGDGLHSRAAGWRDQAVGQWGSTRVSQILQEGGGDGSDFALVLAALVHALGARVRLSCICVGATSSGSVNRCRLVTEARVGYHPQAAAEWVGARHASGLGARGREPPRIHFRRESDGATWLSLAWHVDEQSEGTNADAESSPTFEQQPGGPYAFPGIDLDQTEWTTFYPFDEHGCKWHVRGAEVDSTGRVQGSAVAQSISAIVKRFADW